jgi:FKBP-type peptidyl-prolyl cis-trans isomerase
MKNFLFVFLSGAIALTVACGDGNLFVPTDPAIQAAEDSAIIVNYLADLGYEGEEVGVLPSGTRYVILDSGKVVEDESKRDSISIDESDIVTFHFTGKLINDTIFDTSIKEVADSIRIKVAEDTVGLDDVSEHLVFLDRFDEDNNYEPITITYSSSGWTSTGLFIDGFSDGISATFNKMRIEGSAIVVMPSSEAYGERGSGALIPPNTVLVFELYPIEVIKQ